MFRWDDVTSVQDQSSPDRWMFLLWKTKEGTEDRGLALMVTSFHQVFEETVRSPRVAHATKWHAASINVCTVLSSSRQCRHGVVVWVCNLCGFDLPVLLWTHTPFPHSLSFSSSLPAASTVTWHQTMQSVLKQEIWFHTITKNAANLVEFQELWI